MTEKTIMASRFKAECLALLDQVERTRVPLVVTKHGRPVARVVPLDQPPEPRTTTASVRLKVAEDAAYYSTGEAWSADG
jgi:prevent-host-death family protein